MIKIISRITRAASVVVISGALFVASYQAAPVTAAAASTVLVVQLKHAEATDVLAVLQSIYGKALAAAADVRTNKVTFVGTPAQIAAFRKIVTELDTIRAPKHKGTVELRSFKVKNQLAADSIAKTLSTFLGVGTKGNTFSVVLSPSRRVILVRADRETLDSIENNIFKDLNGERFDPTTHITYTVKNAIPYPIPSGSTVATSTVQDLATATQQIVNDTGSSSVHVIADLSYPRIVVSGPQEGVFRALAVLDELDQRPAQLELYVQIIEYDETLARNVGISLPANAIQVGATEFFPGVNGASPTPPPFLALGKVVKTQPLSIPAQLNLLLATGAAHIRANPRLTTLSGRLATVNVVDNIPFVASAQSANGIVTSTITNYQTGTKLDIVAIVNPDGSIGMYVHPSYATLTQITAQGAPQVSQRDTASTVILEHDQEVVISGLDIDTSNEVASKIPMIGDLPLIGRLFRQKVTTSSRQKIAIVIKPIVSNFGSLASTPTPAPTGTPNKRFVPTPPPRPRYTPAGFETIPPGSLPSLQPPANAPSQTPRPSGSPRPSPSATR